MKSMISDKRGQLDINLAVTAILGLILASAFLVIGIVVLQGVVDGGDFDAATTATGTFTQSSISVEGEIITLGSETYTVHNTTTGEFYLTQAGNTTAVYLAELLVAEITANSTLVTATDSGSGIVAITSVLSGDAGNYASTENMTNGAFGATTLTGGLDADTLYDTMTTVTSDIESSMSLAGTLILVIIGVAILMLLAGVMVIMRVFR